MDDRDPSPEELTKIIAIWNYRPIDIADKLRDGWTIVDRDDRFTYLRKTTDA